MKKGASEYKHNHLRKPKNGVEYVQIWGWMDDVVHFTKPKRSKAVSFWEKNCVPRHGDGTLIATKILPDNTAIFLSYDDIAVNRFWYESAFREDLKNYKRIYNLFIQVMGMEK